MNERLSGCFGVCWVDWAGRRPLVKASEQSKSETALNSGFLYLNSDTVSTHRRSLPNSASLNLDTSAYHCRLARPYDTLLHMRGPR
ncbi:unnamed protein product [Protopolystoma xenopodis]|uniref:Uncharacterized protein n=1 Tax=Protopolystoma xenopodis TaxID=117903 RepID=A0A448XQL6_9PLAT|nr:unnamed protein product [Protopolystoma xenopodis]